MKEILLEWSYWIPVLVSIGILMLYSILSGGRWAFMALLIVKVIALIYFLILPEWEATLLPSIALSCALHRLIVGWKKTSWPERVACIVFGLLHVVICGSAGVFVFLLFQSLLSIIYILPRRKYRQEGKLKCFSLWIAQFIALLILVFPMVNFRISFLLNSEASYGIAILLMPVITMLPVALCDLLLPDKRRKVIG